LIGNEVQHTRAMNGPDGKRHSRGEAAVREPPARLVAFSRSEATEILMNEAGEPPAHQCFFSRQAMYG
jgi:hypothetical protein